MITIAEIAKNLGVTQQAIYQKLKRNGISLESLTIEKRNGKRVFYADSVKETINELFNVEQTNIEQTTANVELETIKSELEKIKADNQSLINKVEYLESQIADLKTDRDNWQKVAEQAQVLQLAQLKALPAPKQNFFQRIFKRES